MEEDGGILFYPSNGGMDWDNFKVVSNTFKSADFLCVCGASGGDDNDNDEVVECACDSDITVTQVGNARLQFSPVPYNGTYTREYDVGVNEYLLTAKKGVITVTYCDRNVESQYITNNGTSLVVECEHIASFDISNVREKSNKLHSESFICTCNGGEVVTECTCDNTVAISQQRFENSSGLIRLQLSQPRPQARAGHALPKACGHGHGVTLSFWCHATCQSLSTAVKGRHLPASHTPATYRTEEAKLQAVSADEAP